MQQFSRFIPKLRCGIPSFAESPDVTVSFVLAHLWDEMAGRDNTYLVQEVALLLSRDMSIHEESSLLPHEPLPGDHTPSVIPAENRSLLFAPLGFVTENVDAQYLLARSLWCRFWCRLESISSLDDTILVLCAQFESLAEMTSPRVAEHCQSLGRALLDYGFSWIRFAGAGYLAPRAVLSLWDIIVATHSLVVLPVLAAAIVWSKQSLILGCSRVEDLDSLMNDGRAIQVVPLLQDFLQSAQIEEEEEDGSATQA